MMEPFEEASRYFAEHWKWQLHKDTFQSISDDIWICKVTTTWRKAKGQDEATFYILYDVMTHNRFQMDEATIRKLADHLALSFIDNED